MSERRVKLTWQSSRYYASDTEAIRVRIEATDANLMPDKIFAYLLLPVKAGTDNRAGMFDHICSPADLEDYPEDEPVSGSRPAWFRLNYVDVLLRSREEVDDFVRQVRADVDALKTALDRIDTLEPGGDIWVGSPPDEEPES
jgi:hypothetical protein